MAALDRPFDEVVATYERATRIVPTRAEALHAAALYCREKGRYAEGQDYARRGLEVHAPVDGLFVQLWVYDYGLLDEFAVNAYWAGAFHESLDASLKLLNSDKLPSSMQKRVASNASFAANKLSTAHAANLGKPVTESMVDERKLVPHSALDSMSGCPSDVVPRSRIFFDGCPLCEGRDVSVIRSVDCSRHALYQPVVDRIMTWMQCNSCTHVYTDGYFTPEVADIIFERTNKNQEPGADFERQRYVSARMVERVARYINGGTWLDVGFGNGSLLFTAEEWGFFPVALDLRRSSVEAMRGFGVEAHCVDISALTETGRYSVISMADVLEHMPFPKRSLSSAKRLLRPEGVLFVSMPNYNCLAWRLLDSANLNPYWAELEHFHNFSRARLYTLLSEFGFEVVHYAVSERYRLCMEVIAKQVG
jgi:SAM-dependent methyltransferase